ncbi:flavocytochrome c [soil metagenome]
MNRTDYGVIVVGGGGAGFAAAIAARESGASVLVVEAADRPGGSTAMCGGVFYAAGTSIQRAAGIIDDTPDAMYEYMMTLNQWRLEPGLIHRFSDAATETLEWLVSIGVVYQPEKLYTAGVETVRRGHMAEGAGFAVFRALEQTAGARGVEVVLNTRVQKLLTDVEGRVVGIEVEGQAVSAGAVILTTGGFGANADLLATLFPSAARHGDWVHYIGGRHNRGDGLLMGQAAGGAIEGHDCGGLNLTPGFRKAADAYLPGWLMIVNEQGRRFMDETAPYAVQDGLVNAQPGHHCFAIMDEAARRSARADAEITDPLGLGDTMAYNWVAETIAEQVALGRVKQADTLAELAVRTGIRADALETTAEIYSGDVAKGFDTHFRKAFRPLLPVSTPPFYAVELRTATIGTTGTGLRIDDGAHVLDEAGRRIAGLYAGGECTGGFYGDRYLAGGASLAQAIVWGRLAGFSAIHDGMCVDTREQMETNP